MKLLISFIIPFYNGEKTIFTMLDSIYAMGMKPNEFEVIIVDDCSPISAESVLAEYVTTHSNMRIVRHDVNRRQGGAKNTGIRLAKGEYIAFADQDDVINPKEMQTALSMALENKVDMLACHYNIRKEDGSIREDGIDKGEGLVMSGKEFCEQYFMTGYNLAPWANLYRREFLLKIARPYEENVVMEDADWIAWHWIHANKVGIFNKPIYTWIMNPSSITHSLHYVNRADWVKYGYRKIRDAQEYKDLSTIFANIMITDGQNNIMSGMKKAWKVDSYVGFYRHLSEELPSMQGMKWSGMAKVLINYQFLSIIGLSIIGPILKCINYARYKFAK